MSRQNSLKQQIGCGLFGQLMAQARVGYVALRPTRETLGSTLAAGGSYHRRALSRVVFLQLDGDFWLSRV
jgi:hypothetical protein